jgi:60 kDa SS-A/Ro ribonucleoprotein
LQELLDHGRGEEAVAIIRTVSTEGRAPRQTPTLLALALCTLCDDEATRKAAHEALPSVARTPTMLFEYLDIREACARPVGRTGWGRAHRRAVSQWYNTPSVAQLASAVTKYQNRNGYAHKDALRLSHAVPNSLARNVVFAYATGGVANARAKLLEELDDARPRRSLSDAALLARERDIKEAGSTLFFLTDVAKAKVLQDTDTMIALIEKNRFTWEYVPSPMLSSAPVWEALLASMPMTAMLRSLAKMTAVGLLRTDSCATELVAARLRDPKLLAKARVHPMAVLLATRTYQSGQGALGKSKWKPVGAIVRALGDAFVLSFAAVRPAGKRTMLSLDVSGSMAAPCTGGGKGANITCAEASAAMAMVTMRTEPECTAMCFAGEFAPFGLTKETTLPEAFELMQDRVFGMTDCSLPMQYAATRGMEVDTFVVFTDSETYHGSIHPCEALRRYRTSSGVTDAKLVVVAMASNGFTIADPADEGMLDVVGFDAVAPCVIADFSAGRM